MTYNPNIPTAGQSLGETRDPTRTNFSVSNTAFAVNHIAFSESGQGKHKYLQLPEQSPGPATSANEGGLYTKNTSNGTNLYWRPESTASGGDEYRLTTNSSANMATFGTNTNYTGALNGGWTFLPGGMIVFYGSTTVVASSSNVVITFPFTYPSGSAPYCIQLSWEKATFTEVTSVSVVAGTQTSAGFSIRAQGISGNATYYWLAVGI